MYLIFLFILGNSFNQSSNAVPSLATIASNEIPVAVSRSSQSPPVSATRPPFYSLNAAAAATSSTMGNYAYYLNIFVQLNKKL